MKILIVGNGSIGIHKNLDFYINNHTGNFLNSLSSDYSVTYTEIPAEFDENNNLQNYNLSKTNVSIHILPNRKALNFLPKSYSLIKNHDFIYLFYPGTLSMILALIAISLRKPIGLYIRGQYYNRNTIDRFILKKSKFILTVSPSFSKSLSKFCSNVNVIKPMISIVKKDLKHNREFNIPSTWNILFVGRVEERKGIYELLEISEILKIEGIDFKLNIVGGGDFFNLIDNKIKDLGLNSNIILHGLITDKQELKSLYDSSNVFLFTSHDEGFPRVLYEAMASALPIFTTFVGGISGRMTNMENCIEIPVKNSKGAAMTLIQHIKNAATLKKIGENGLKTIENVINGYYLSHENLLKKNLNNEESD